MSKRQKIGKTDGLGPHEIKQIRGAIRLVWQRSHARKLCVQRCTRKDGYTYCEKCKSRTPKLKVDHIKNVGDLDDGFIPRLFCPSAGLQGLCPECHGIKTQLEREAGRAAKPPTGAKLRKPRAQFLDTFG